MLAKRTSAGSGNWTYWGVVEMIGNIDTEATRAVGRIVEPGALLDAFVVV